MKKAKFNIFNVVLLNNTMYPYWALKKAKILGVFYDENAESYLYYIKCNNEYEYVDENFITFLEEE